MQRWGAHKEMTRPLLLSQRTPVQLEQALLLFQPWKPAACSSSALLKLCLSTCRAAAAPSKRKSA